MMVSERHKNILEILERDPDISVNGVTLLSFTTEDLSPRNTAAPYLIRAALTKKYHS